MTCSEKKCTHDCDKCDLRKPCKCGKDKTMPGLRKCFECYTTSEDKYDKLVVTIMSIAAKVGRLPLYKDVEFFHDAVNAFAAMALRFDRRDGAPYQAFEDVAYALLGICLVLADSATIEAEKGRLLEVLMGSVAKETTGEGSGKGTKVN